MLGMDLRWGSWTTPSLGTEPHHVQHGTTEGRESERRQSSGLFIPRQALPHQTPLPLQPASLTSPEGQVAPSRAQPRGDRPRAAGDLQHPEGTASQTRPADAKRTQLPTALTFLEQSAIAVPSLAASSLCSPTLQRPSQPSPCSPPGDDPPVARCAGAHTHTVHCTFQI